MTITIITTTDHADRARAELEEAWNVVHRNTLQGRHYDMELAYEKSAEPTDEAVKALARLVELQRLIIEWKARPCSGSHEECGRMIREDVACLAPCAPHEDACDEHLQGELRWADSHEESDCCSIHCDGAEHTADAIVVRRAA